MEMMVALLVMAPQVALGSANVSTLPPTFISYFVVLGLVLILSKLLYRCIGSEDTGPDSHGFPRTPLY